MNVNEQLVQSLLFEEESTNLDFKRDQYKFTDATEAEKSELLKDILAFANAFRRADAFIVIGVKDQKGQGKSLVGVDELLDDAQLQQFVNSKTQKPLSFSYRNLTFRETNISIIQIPVQERPFYISKDYGRLKKNVVYIRRGSATDEATPDEILTMRPASPATSVVTAPKLIAAFLSTDHGVTQHLKVLSRKKLDQTEVLTHLNKLILQPEDINLVKKHSTELGHIKDRYPNGEQFPAFPLEDVTGFQDEVLNEITLATDNFEEFLNRYELTSRSYELFSDGISKIFSERGIPRHHVFFNLQNSGTSPAEGIIAYIKGSSKIRFMKREKLQKETIRFHQEVPEHVTRIISQAKKIDLGITEPFITMYERVNKRKYNDYLGFEPSRISVPTIHSLIPDPYQCSVKENKLKIFVRDTLMHNHNFEMYAEPFCLCPLLALGETVEIKYEVHAKNLPQPSLGSLVIEAVQSLGEL